MTCGTCHAVDGHQPGCPEEGPHLLAANPPTDPPLTKEEREQFAAELRRRLETNRTTFVVDKFMFEPQPQPGEHQRLVDVSKGGLPDHTKVVSAAALKLLLDYCEHEDWPMGFLEYCAGMFHGRMPAPGECAFDLLPDVRERVSADRLGLSHIYGGNE